MAPPSPSSSNPAPEAPQAPASERTDQAEAQPPPSSKKRIPSKRRRRSLPHDDGKGAAASSPKNNCSRFVEERRNYYRRLLHACRKDVNKSAKHTKRLECQRLARQLKEKTSSLSSSSSSHEYNDKTNTNTTTKSDKLETKYRATKSLDVEVVVREVLRRLGIENLNPEPVEEEGGRTPVNPRKHPSDSATQEAAAERVLRHKRMLECVERWNDQVTEYRRWCLRREDGVGGTRDDHDSCGGSGKKRRRRTDATHTQVSAAAAASSGFAKSVFVRLGDDEEDDDEGGGPDGDAPVKKNRPGQRARQAKAEALRAKEEGRVRDRSLNWREPKAKGERPTGTGANERRHDWNQERNPPVRDSKATAASDEKAHPSWQAAAQKSNRGGIVKFQGTKVTFS